MEPLNIKDDLNHLNSKPQVPWSGLKACADNKSKRVMYMIVDSSLYLNSNRCGVCPVIAHC